MDSLASNARFRQRAVKYAERYGVTKAGNRFRLSRQVIYKWRERYDGSWQSLEERSHRPHHHPREHTEAEIKLIQQCYRYHKDDRLILWKALKKKGYKRSYGSMLRVVRRLQLCSIKKKSKTRQPKPYKRAEYPGQKIQIDVKFVPSKCVANGQKYYQYTAIDECTRVVYREMYDEHSTYSSKEFSDESIEAFPVSGAGNTNR